MAAWSKSEPDKLGETDNLHGSPLVAIAPIAGVVFTAFFVIGLALPVLPLHVHEDLGMGAFMVGLVAGCQFVASLVSRLWAGRITDTRGPKRAVLLGLSLAVAGGACYLLSLTFIRTPMASVGILLAGRSLVGGAESLIVTGGMLWSLGRVAPGRSAQVIAWVGILGAAIAGAGFSLVFPCLGLEAVRRVPPANRGIAMGAYNAFLDLTLGVGSPLLGLLAGKAGIAAVFDASAIAVVLAIPIALRLRAETSRNSSMEDDYGYMVERGTA